MIQALVVRSFSAYDVLHLCFHQWMLCVLKSPSNTHVVTVLLVVGWFLFTRIEQLSGVLEQWRTAADFTYSRELSWVERTYEWTNKAPFLSQ